MGAELSGARCARARFRAIAQAARQSPTEQREVFRRRGNSGAGKGSRLAGKDDERRQPTLEAKESAQERRGAPHSRSSYGIQPAGLSVLK